MHEEYEFEEPGDDFRNLTAEEVRAIKSNHKEIKSITHRNELSRWLPLVHAALLEPGYLVIGYSCDSRGLEIALTYDTDANKYVYQGVRLADGDEFKRYWCR
jgi:hypothetical protein